MDRGYRDDAEYAITNPQIGANVRLAISGTTAVTSASVTTQSRIRLCSDVACYVAQGTTAIEVTVSNGMPLMAGVPEFVYVDVNTKGYFAAITDGDSGYLHATVMG
jgi:hypothetical protein